MIKIFIILGAVSFFIFSSCSRGYIEVRNQSDEPIQNVHWGGIIYLNDIDSSQEAGKETDIYEPHYIYFRKDGIEYHSRNKYMVDAFTSQTYIYEDTSSVVQTSLEIGKSDSLIPDNYIDASTGSTSIIESIQKWMK